MAVILFVVVNYKKLKQKRLLKKNTKPLLHWYRQNKQCLRGQGEKREVARKFIIIGTNKPFGVTKAFYARKEVN